MTTGKGGHPNILRFYESIDTFSHVYLITEYLEGIQLSDYLKSLPSNRMQDQEAI